MEFKTFEEIMDYMGTFVNLERATAGGSVSTTSANTGNTSTISTSHESSTHSSNTSAAGNTLYNNRTYRLDRMRAIMQVLGNPQDSYKTVHVAGSKGKGSTASFIACALKAAGHRVGLYMSPHVSDYRERFTLCGRFVDDSTLIATGNDLFRRLEGFHFSDALGKSSPTTFELYTAYAFLLFKRLGCTWAVIETGLGGRLDATNIITPQASILTPIELEHTDILGDTIEKIAIEKSKIIKKNIPSFSALQSADALSVFRKEAKEQNSPFYYLGDFDTDITENHIGFSDGYSWNCHLSMPGLVQAQNCALALLAIRQLGLYIPQITEKALEQNQLPGRMERINWKRTLYLDGAHTKNSIKSTISTFRTLYPGHGGVCLFGSVTGKNHQEMAKEVLSAFDKIVISRPGTFKKSDIQALYNLFKSLAKPNQIIAIYEDASDALSWCLQHTKPEEAILATGSFYLAGEVKNALCL